MYGVREYNCFIGKTVRRLMSVFRENGCFIGGSLLGLSLRIYLNFPILISLKHPAAAPYFFNTYSIGFLVIVLLRLCRFFLLCGNIRFRFDGIFPWQFWSRVFRFDKQVFDFDVGLQYSSVNNSVLMKESLI